MPDIDPKLSVIIDPRRFGELQMLAEDEPRFLEDLIASLKETVQNGFAAMAEAGHNSNAERVTMCAHRLRGSLEMVGAQKIGAHLNEIEQSGSWDSEDSGRLDSEFEEFLRAAEDLMRQE